MGGEDGGDGYEVDDVGAYLLDEPLPLAFPERSAASVDLGEAGVGGVGVEVEALDDAPKKAGRNALRSMLLCAAELASADPLCCMNWGAVECEACCC